MKATPLNRGKTMQRGRRRKLDEALCWFENVFMPVLALMALAYFFTRS